MAGSLRDLELSSHSILHLAAAFRSDFIARYQQLPTPATVSGMAAVSGMAVSPSSALNSARPEALHAVQPGVHAEKDSFPAEGLLPPLLFALPCLFLVLFMLGRLGSSPSSSNRAFDTFPWPGRRRHPHLPPRPLLPPSQHEQLHDEKYLSRILEADQQPPRQ
jgi:hypothetical protein